MTRIPPIDTHDGRRAWAFLSIWGGCVTFTVFAAIGVWMVREYPQLAFYLALAAHVQVLIGMSAMGWAMGRRAKIEVTKDGAKLDDSIVREGDTVRVEKEQ